MVSCFPPWETAASLGTSVHAQHRLKVGRVNTTLPSWDSESKKAVFHVLVQVAALLTGHQKEGPATRPQIQSKLMESEGPLNSVPP